MRLRLVEMTRERFSRYYKGSRLPHFVLHVSSNEFSKTIRTRRSLENKQIDMRCCLNVVSSSNDYENRTFGLRAQDVFENLFEETNIIFFC